MLDSRRKVSESHQAQKHEAPPSVVEPMYLDPKSMQDNGVAGLFFDSLGRDFTYCCGPGKDHEALCSP